MRHIQHQRQTNNAGKPIIWKWGPQRLENEGTALLYLKKHTTIPIPRVIYCGQDQRGLVCLEVERKYGIAADTAGDQCRMPPGRLHTSKGPCSTCEQIASNNVNYFIDNVVLSQLRRLESTETRLDGFVLSPPGVEEDDSRSAWLPKRALSVQRFVFSHMDLSRSNILLGPKTLEVVSINDWEGAGFFSAEMEHPVWRLNYAEYMNTYRDVEGIESDKDLIQR